MERNLDLMRKILLCIEAEPGCDRISTCIVRWPWEDEAHEAIAYNFILLLDAGYVVGEVYQSGDCAVKGLTHPGHDFLDSIRDEAVWLKVKGASAELKGLSLDLIKAMASGFLKKLIADKTGVQI